MEERALDDGEAGPIEAAYGAWTSPILVDDLVAEVVRLAEPWVDGDDVYFAAQWRWNGRWNGCWNVERIHKEAERRR